MMDYSQYELMDMPNPDFPIKICRYIPKTLGTCFRSHWHEHMELLFIENGSVMVKCSQNSFQANSGDLVIVNGNELHSGESAGLDLSYYYIILDLSLLKSCTVDACQTKYITPIIQNIILFKNIVENDKSVRECINSLICEYEKKDFAYEISMKSALYRLMSLLLRDYVGKVLSPKEFDNYSRKTNNIKKAIKYIESNYTEKITIDRLAAIAGMSRFYFCRSFKEVTGQTASDYVNYIRICMAEEQLANADLSITDIAMSVGFDDINYFSRLYKRHKGVSPSSSRRNMK